MVPFESLGTVCYSHSIATMAVTLANTIHECNRHTARHRKTAKAALIHSITRQKPIISYNGINITARDMDLLPKVGIHSDSTSSLGLCKSSNTPISVS